MRLYRQTVEDFGLFSGMEMTVEQLAQLQQAAGAMSAKMRAVRIVAAASVSEKDLKNRLIRKGEDPTHAKDAVRWMTDMQLLDDRKTAEQIVRSCISKGYGVARAKQALYEKRIPKEYWQDALEDYPDQSDAIRSFLRGRLVSTSDKHTVRKAIDALLRRGHSYSQIRRELEQLSVDAEEYPEE